MMLVDNLMTYLGHPDERNVGENDRSSRTKGSSAFMVWQRWVSGPSDSTVFS